MATRALTHIKDGDTTLVTVYRQYDGYPDGHGLWLAEFLRSRTLVNGLSGKDAQFNGAPDLATHFVVALKSAMIDNGGIYIKPPDAFDVGEEFTYVVHVPTVKQIESGDTNIHVTVTIFNDPPAFYGDVEQFATWCAS